MGMFDSVKCDFPICPEITGKDCQTKEIDRWMGGTMSTYYIDPAGRLWSIDYTGTADYIMNEDAEGFLGKFTRESTGKNGKVAPYYLTDYVTIYPADGRWNDRTEARLHIIEGVVQSYQLINREPCSTV